MVQMINGIDVKLYDTTGFEVVQNVLAGEPTGNEFTLAIPKGDTHVWTDAKVEFFGRMFRTIGFPKEGIESNIPLFWNKQVKIKQLITNADLTVFEKDTFIRHKFNDVYLIDNRGVVVKKNGEQTKGDVEIEIYAPNIKDRYVPKIGDIIVWGECNFEFDVTSQQTVSESLRNFRANYHDFAVIKSVNQLINAVESDYKIIAG